MFHDIKALLRKYNFSPKKSLGQNFLINPYYIKKIVDSVPKSSTIIEIGPGLGFLTKELAKHVKKLICIELDKNFQLCLESLAGELGNIELVWGDARDFSFDYPVVSNLPYYLSSELTFKILESNIPWAVLTYQKEFGSRILSSFGSSDYSRLSVMSQLLSKPKLLFKIPKSAFYPVPKVDSVTLYFEILKKPRNYSRISELVKILFNHPRKTINASLKASGLELRLDNEWGKRRVRSLSIDDILLITNKFYNK